MLRGQKLSSSDLTRLGTQGAQSSILRVRQQSTESLPKEAPHKPPVTSPLGPADETPCEPPVTSPPVPADETPWEPPVTSPPAPGDEAPCEPPDDPKGEKTVARRDMSESSSEVQSIEAIAHTVVEDIVEAVADGTISNDTPRTRTIGDVLEGLSNNTPEQTTTMLCEALGANSKCMDALKLAELRVICTHLALSTSGKKSDIKSRIIAYHRKLTTDA